MSRRFSSLEIGEKFVVKTGYTPLPFKKADNRDAYSLHRVIDKTYAKIVSSSLANGETIEFPIDPYYGTISDWRLRAKVVMTDQLPDAPEDIVLSFVLPILERRNDEHAIAVYLTSTDMGFAEGHIVQPASRTTYECSREPANRPLSLGNIEYLERAITLDMGDNNWKAGDLICGTDFQCEVINGKTITTLRRTHVVKNFGDLGEVERFWPRLLDADASVLAVHYKSLDHFLFEEGRAEVACDPDAALVLVTRSPSGKRLSHQVVAYTGSLLYVWDDADCYFSCIDGVGLWHATNLKGWSYQSYDGDWDAGINFDVEPASLSILSQFDFDKEQLDAELKEMVDDEDEPSVSKYIALAEEWQGQKNRVPTGN